MLSNMIKQISGMCLHASVRARSYVYNMFGLGATAASPETHRLTQADESFGSVRLPAVFTHIYVANFRPVCVYAYTNTSTQTLAHAV